MWDIIRISKSGKYDYAKVPNHPHANKDGYVLYHRIIMENYIGRLLTKEEVVHHIDGNGHNNTIENLQLLDRIEHNLLHGKEQKHSNIYICPYCLKEFERTNKKIHKGYKLTFCSQVCNGKYYYEHGNKFGKE